MEKVIRVAEAEAEINSSNSASAPATGTRIAFSIARSIRRAGFTPPHFGPDHTKVG